MPTMNAAAIENGSCITAGAIMDNPITANNTATSATTHFITNKTHPAKMFNANHLLPDRRKKWES
jgi:hypothetical protein